MRRHSVGQAAISLPKEPRLGTHFTGFTGTKVQILTQKALPAAAARAGYWDWWGRTRVLSLLLSLLIGLLALLVQKVQILRPEDLRLLLLTYADVC